MTATHKIISKLLNSGLFIPSIEEKELEQAARELGILDYDNLKDLPISVNGRQVTRTKCSPEYIVELKTNDTKSTIIIRIDDKNHPEFWLEIQVPIVKVLHLLK